MKRWFYSLFLLPILVSIFLTAAAKNPAFSSHGSCYFTTSTSQVKPNSNDRFSVTIYNESEENADFNIRFSVPKTNEEGSKQQDRPVGSINAGSSKAFDFTLADLTIVEGRDAFHISVAGNNHSCNYTKDGENLTNKIIIGTVQEEPEPMDGATSNGAGPDSSATDNATISAKSFFWVNCPEGFKFCENTIGGILTALLPTIYGLAAMLALLFLIWGGIRYMTARGDPKAVDAARGIITSAIIGLLVVIFVGVIFGLIAAVFKIDIFGLVPAAYADHCPTDPTIPSNDIGCNLKLGGVPISHVFPDLGTLFTRIVRFALAAAALIFFVMLIWGGFRYLNAGGDPKSADAARDTLTNAGIGLLIVVVSLMIIEIATRVAGFSIFG